MATKKKKPAPRGPAHKSKKAVTRRGPLKRAAIGIDGLTPSHVDVRIDFQLTAWGMFAPKPGHPPFSTEAMVRKLTKFFSVRESVLERFMRGTQATLPMLLGSPVPPGVADLGLLSFRGDVVDFDGNVTRNLDVGIIGSRPSERLHSINALTAALEDAGWALTSAGREPTMSDAIMSDDEDAALRPTLAVGAAAGEDPEGPALDVPSGPITEAPAKPRVTEGLLASEDSLAIAVENLADDGLPATPSSNS